MVDTSKMVFVFGSNEGGIHGAGAARHAAICRGAKYGCGFGHNGADNIHTAPGSFAIPTKGIRFTTNEAEKRSGGVGETLPLDVIQRYVDAFLTYAYARPDLQFQVTRIGCGLAGLKDSDVAPMFIGANKYSAPNIWFDNVWMHEFAAAGNMSMAGYNIWGTF